MSKPATFEEYLREVGPQLTLSLVEKANCANRLAKLSTGGSKLVLYRLKCKHLSRALDLKPDWFYIDSRTCIGKRVILGITSKIGFAFHIPADRLLRGSLVTGIRAHQTLGEEIAIAQTVASARQSS